MAIDKSDFDPKLFETLGKDNYLGDPKVVEAIVRSFLLAAIKARSAEKDPEAWLHARTAAEARRFLGQNDALIPIPSWNAPDGELPRHIKRRFNLSDDDPLVIVQVPFYALCRAYLEAVEEEAAGRDWQHLIDGAIEFTVALMLGTDELLFPAD